MTFFPKKKLASAYTTHPSIYTCLISRNDARYTRYVFLILSVVLIKSMLIYSISIPQNSILSEGTLGTIVVKHRKKKNILSSKRVFFTEIID